MSHLGTRDRHRPDEPVDYPGYPTGDDGYGYHEDFDDYDDYDDYPPGGGRRWRPAAVVAAVLVAAGIGAAVILNSDSSGSQVSRVEPVGPVPTATAPPDRTTSAAPTTTAPPPSASRSPETITTLTPGRPTATAEAVAPPPVDPRTVRYTVTGTKQLLDLVTVIYTDAQGMLRTDFNVTLPWNKTVVLNPGVQLKSVVATSLSSRLDCAITDARGQVIAASANNTFIATCTR